MKGAERPTKITETLMSEVLNPSRQNAHQTVRDIALQNDIGISIAHKILTENLNMEWVCVCWVPRLLTEDDQKRRV